MEASEDRKSTRVGWWIWLVLSAFLALNGVALYFISANPTTFEQDTGVPYAEVEQAYPSVAEQIVREGQTISAMLVVVGLMAGIAAFAGLRHGSSWAWWSVAVVLAMLAYFSVRFLAVEGRPDIGGFYGGAALLGLIGQVLARRGPGDG